MKKYKLLKNIVWAKAGVIFEYHKKDHDWFSTWIELVEWKSLWQTLDLIKALWIENKEYFEKVIEIETRWYPLDNKYTTANWQFGSAREFHRITWTIFKDNDQLQTWKFLRNHILNMESKYGLPDRKKHITFNVNFFEDSANGVWVWPSSWWGRPEWAKRPRNLWENYYSRYFTWWIGHTDMKWKDINDRISYLKAYENTLQDLLYND